MKVKQYILGPIATNCYLLQKEEEFLLIDPAAGSYEKIWPDLRGKNIPIFLTHSHWDHIADVHLWKNNGSEIWVHRLDAPNLEKPGTDLLPCVLNVPGASPNHFFEVGEDISILGTTLLILHTPGHSPGSVCLFFPDEKILFTGDTLFKGNAGSTLFPTSDRHAMHHSIHQLAKLPKDTIVYPGHGEKTSLGDEKWIEKVTKH